MFGLEICIVCDVFVKCVCHAGEVIHKPYHVLIPAKCATESPGESMVLIIQAM